MRIGIDARFIGNGSGLGRYMYKLLEFVLKNDQKNQYDIIIYKDDVEIIDFPYKNYQVKVVSYGHYSYGEQIGYLRFLNSLNCDLVHFANFNYPILYRKKFIVTIHDLTLMFYPGRLRRGWIAKLGYWIAMKSAVKNAKLVIAISEFTKRDIVKYLGGKSENIQVIYEAPDERLVKINDLAEVERIKNKYQIKKKYYLYVGQWRIHKNLVRLIEAFARVRDRGIETQLLLVGKEDPRYPEVREIIEKSKYKDDILVTGYVPDEDLSAIYTGALCFVFPSLYEGIGLPPLEAMRCGIPVISSDASCMPEILMDSVLYFDPYDVSEIAFAMERIFNDADLRKSLVDKGYKQISKYSWEKMAQETLDVYKQVLKV